MCLAVKGKELKSARDIVRCVRTKEVVEHDRSFYESSRDVESRICSAGRIGRAVALQGFRII